MLNFKEKFHNDPIKENNFEYQILQQENWLPIETKRWDSEEDLKRPFTDWGPLMQFIINLKGDTYV